MPRKPVETCKPEQIAMIEAFLSGASKRDAFIQAFPDRAKSLKDPDQAAIYEFQKDAVKKEIEKRRAAQNRALEKRAESEAEKLNKLWDREKHLQSLIDLKKWSEGVRMTAESNRDAVQAGKLERDTMESIGKMLGFDAPVKVESDSKITVVFGDGGPDGSDDWTA